MASTDIDTRYTGVPDESIGDGYKIVPARHPWRLVGSIVAAALIAITLNSILTNPRWGWGVFVEFFF
ncbi:hypothetical protein GCM10007913_18100 [Devosia yakushimensis]|uniref:Uncharacterized protein n=1 Tax=Devosia yakushimensis TaxID=470028 RepID=A0ABQ5UD20_9HYPH|nr:hypothetical protein GCM10007913_18100 [Devosia yakushimensis]